MPRIMQPFFRDDCMDVEWNRPEWMKSVTDGHSHSSFRSDTHEEIREVEIAYSRRTMETMELLPYLRFREVQKILDELHHKG